MTTITIKTADLTGAALDWAVALASGVAVNIIPPNKYPNLVRYADSLGKNFHPSTNWAQAGPIIEAEQIGISSPGSLVHRNGGPRHGWGASGYWSATTWVPGANGRRSIKHHETSPLIAAMRCYVQHKLGDTVDIPQELMS
ncbi:phage protein NinX family protein [Comamonas sp.]|uniref:phage protein NinX family protein n=1 Tax=Comamonas sp. TaxID=34028 RepID=UPI003D115A19